MPAISDWLARASSQLTAIGIQSARLDAEIILSHTLRKSRTFLHAHGETELSDRQLEIANARLQLRLERTPVAYIIGHKEFYGRLFRVTPATLIPRPESEAIVTLVKEIAQKHLDQPYAQIPKIVDVGAGSGCLGISIKLEVPKASVTLIDISQHALNVATNNAKQLNAEVAITQSNLLANYPFHASIIVANLPYVDLSWERSPETDYEPSLALFANNDGLELINKLIPQAQSHLLMGGDLILEAAPSQHAAVVHLANDHGFRLIEGRGHVVHLHKS